MYFSQENLDLINYELNLMFEQNLIQKNTSYNCFDNKFTNIYNKYLYKTYYNKLNELLELEKNNST